MHGISSQGKEQINRIVEDLFDKIALHFIGNIPKLAHKKLLLIGHKPNLGLAQLFVQSLQNRSPNPLEYDVLKGILDNSHGYVEALKNQTRNRLTEKLDELARDAKLKESKIAEEDLNKAISEELERAQSHMKSIVHSQTTRTKNMGTALDIGRVASSIGDEDPTVFFVVFKRPATCKWCQKIHLMPDGITPRLWKFSELKQGYFVRGEKNPSIMGLHPNCSCQLTYLSKGFGFDSKGNVAYVAEKHDEYTKQRK